MPDVFISYRRQDSSGYAGRLNDQLAAHFGADHVFIDVDDISPGVDFADAIERKVSSCDVLLALIGPRWLSSKLQDPNDFVRREIASALARNVRIIPVLVGGAAIPQQSALPSELSPLVRRQVLEISDSRFHEDVKRLIRAIENSENKILHRRRSWALAVLLLVAAVGGIGISRLPRWRGQPVTVEAVSDISGKWRAEMHQDGQKPYAIHLDLQARGNLLFGTVAYPTGSAAILEGKIQSRQVDFVTRHVPQFESEPATVRIQGTISGDDAILLLLTSDSGMARGTARRVR